MNEVVKFITNNYYDWKEELNSLESDDSEFQKWLFIHISSVLFGGKAGELLNLSSAQASSSFNDQAEIIEQLSKRWNFCFHMLSDDKVIVYNNEKVHYTLTSVPPCILQEKLNYSIGISPRDFLETIKKRWRETEQIPHEIGLALGYPVKDVLGYMGLLPLKCMGMCGWRIYGDPKPSLNECRKYNQARHGALIFLAA